MSKCHCEHGVDWFRVCRHCDPEWQILLSADETLAAHEGRYPQTVPLTVEQFRAHLWQGALLGAAR